MSKKYSHKDKDPFLAREAEKYASPIPSREFILSVLNESKRPIKRQALCRQFDLVDSEAREAFRRRLKAMVRDGQLFKSPQGYFPIIEEQIQQGKLVIGREGDGYALCDPDKVYFPAFALRGCYEGDVVEVQITQVDSEGQKRGRILKLIEKTQPLVVGRFSKNDFFEVVPFERKFNQNIIIPKEHKSGASQDDIVQVEILREEKYEHHVQPVGKVIEILGDFSTPGIEVQMAIRKFNLPHEWPKGVSNQVKQFNNAQFNLGEHREDITHLPLVTIDGEDAKDFDDAVYCEPRKQGGWCLYVAIADVSHYVQAQTPLDKEAQRRGNSTYFPGSVIPMLPEILSNELCSLKPNVPRYCVVCQMNITPEGEINRTRFYRGLMRSHARLTYTEVAAFFKGEKTAIEKIGSLNQPITALYDLYLVLNAKRVLRGAIDFDTIETRILFDSQNKIKSIIPTERNVAHKIIEECMLAANVSAAKFLQRHKQKTLFRIHDRPPQDKLKALREFLAELGLSLSGKDKPTSKDFADLVSMIKQRNDRHMIETVMLRSLSQAQYAPKNIGHFGLAYPSYVHFTSPIRRYPDLIVHRGIVDILLEKKGKDSSLKSFDFEKLGLACSETERRSDDASRDAQLALKCHFMQDKVGETYQGIISGVASFGIFVELQGIFIEGLVHVTSLGQEYFHYDATHHRMIGDRSRTVYRIGDRLEVQVVRVDIETKKIDLELLTSPGKRQNSQPSRKKTEKKPRKQKQKQKQKKQKKKRSKKKQ